MKYQYNDGGRSAAGYKGYAGDCVARSIAIASGLPYKEVYEFLAAGNKAERKTIRSKRSSGRKTAANGIHVNRKWFKDYMKSIGFAWVPTMRIGQGCKVHLVDGELPMGRLVVSVSKHYTAVIDGVINDTYDPSERDVTVYPNGYPAHKLPKGAVRMENGNGWSYRPNRCVYGYWIFKPFERTF